MAKCSIAITSRPILDSVADMRGFPGWAEWKLRKWFEAVATITLGAEDGAGSGWSMGWLQTISFNDWAIYKGATPSDGSVWLQKGSPTSALTTWLDSEAIGVPFAFYADQPLQLVHGGRLPVATWLRRAPSGPVKLLIQDEPNFAYRYQITNGKTGKTNILTEARIEWRFCAIVALRDPLGRFTILGGVYWSVLRCDVLPPNARGLVLPPGPESLAQVGPVFTGPPTDPSVLRTVSGARLTNHNPANQSEA